MDCSTSRGLMLEFVEGSLPTNLNAAVAQHIRECPSCLAELEVQSSRTRALQKLGRVQAPDQWSEISSSIRRVGWHFFIRRYGLAAAVLGCAAAAAFVLIGRLTAPSYGPGAGASSVPSVPPAAPRAEDSVGERAPAGGAATGSVQPEEPGTPATSEPSPPAPWETSEYGLLENDHYGSMVGQFIGEGADLVAATADGDS